MIVDTGILVALANRADKNHRAAAAVFSLPEPPKLHYIALGESIFRHLQAIYPRASRLFDILDLPHEWIASNPGEVFASHAVRFGFLGVSQGKGFQTFARVVAGVVRRITVWPREGGDPEYLEALITDGTGQVGATWIGRRSIPGLSLGTRLVIEGVLRLDERGIPTVDNPKFEFAL